ncbi:hypothetical protein QQF64_026462 [Cirrhinus molitorella]|uniref:ribonuclease H n=1 Tax=Cirrhinus molitorella TaxID=172907 RepID=A0ABR3N9M4_9TELE
MNSVLVGLIYKSCAVYLDDIVVASPTFEQHLADLKEVLTRLESAGLSVKLEKCQFCRSELTFLGYNVTTNGVQPNKDKVKAVTDFGTPTNVKQVRQFLGLTSYYRRFIHDYARHAEPLFAFTRPGTINKVPDPLSRNPVPSCEAPLEVLPDYAIIGGLDLRTLPPVIFSDREHLRQMQLNDPVTGRLLRMLEGQEDGNGEEVSQYVIQDGLHTFHICGGWSPMEQVTLEKQIFLEVRPMIEKEVGTDLRFYFPIVYSSQLVSGTNCMVKVLVDVCGDGECVHAKIFWDLPCCGGKLTVTEVQYPKCFYDMLEPFEHKK